MILTTHYMDEAEALCDRVAIMDQAGCSSSTPAALVRELDAPIRISVAPGTLDATETPGGRRLRRHTRRGAALTITTREPTRVLTALAQRDALSGLSVNGASLEDVFLELTGREYRA